MGTILRYMPTDKGSIRRQEGELKSQLAALRLGRALVNVYGSLTPDWNIIRYVGQFMLTRIFSYNIKTSESWKKKILENAMLNILNRSGY